MFAYLALHLDCVFPLFVGLMVSPSPILLIASHGNRQCVFFNGDNDVIRRPVGLLGLFVGFPDFYARE